MATTLIGIAQARNAPQRVRSKGALQFPGIICPSLVLADEVARVSESETTPNTTSTQDWVSCEQVHFDGSIHAVNSSWGLPFVVLCWIMDLLRALVLGSEARYLSGR